MTDAKDKAVNLLQEFFSMAGVPFGPVPRKRLDEAVETIIEATLERVYEGIEPSLERLKAPTRQMSTAKTTPFCSAEWDDDGDRHSCYLDEGHSGKHVCGFCDEGQEHPKRNTSMPECSGSYSHGPNAKTIRCGELCEELGYVWLCSDHYRQTVTKKTD